MNFYLLFIASTMVVAYVLDIVTSILNIKSLQPDIPHEFNGIYDSEKYRKSQEYTKVSSKFGLLVSTSNLIVTLCFWFLGGFAFVDSIDQALQIHSHQDLN